MHCFMYMYVYVHFGFHRNWDFLEEMLRNVTMERSKIKDGMIWCMEHAESAEEVNYIH